MKKRLLFIALLLITLFNVITVNADEKREFKVLVIEINPILKTIQNKSLYKNNDGHPYVSEYFGFDRKKALNELIQDLEDMSHNYLDIEIVKTEYLNEFPTYKKEINLIDGKKALRYDEKTYLAISRSSNNKDKGDWYDFIYYPKNKPGSYDFDYDYIIEKYDLINRRNNGEFDQVWLNTIDPSSTYETVMIGKNPFWVNGEPIEKDCDNFIMLNISISRRDANLHALGHGIENILNMVFNGTWFDYNKTYEDATQEEYDKLNLWEKFTLSGIQSKGNHAGVGNVHFPFNGDSDYDYTNKKEVISSWEDWLDYPNLTGEFDSYNSNAWLKFEENNKLGKDQNKDPDRLYMRFWLYLFPHVDGVTDDGYYNNWWIYIADNDFVDSITSNIDTSLKIDRYEEVNLDYTLNYYSGKTEEIKQVTKSNNVHITGDSIKFIDGKLMADELGKSSITIYKDGKSITYKIEVVNSRFLRIIFELITFLIMVLVFILGIVLFTRKKNHKKTL